MFKKFKIFINYLSPVQGRIVKEEYIVEGNNEKEIRERVLNNKEKSGIVLIEKIKEIIN